SSQPSAQPTGMPSGQPSVQPTGQPSSMPSGQPSSQPSAQPSGQPSSQPSSSPTLQPSSQPSALPSSQPSAVPSSQPTAQPTMVPTGQPTSIPTNQPSVQPSMQPTGQPSSMPSGQPSSQPSAQPSGQPSSQPSRQPSSQPSAQPTGMPSSAPTSQPSSVPTSKPSVPSSQPSSQPSSLPSGRPFSFPSAAPSISPSSQPSSQPSLQPFALPSSSPSSQPTFSPSSQPTSTPTSIPTVVPTTSFPTCRPSSTPTHQPFTSSPTKVGETHSPSYLPTSTPTIDFSAYLNTTLYSEVLPLTRYKINASSSDKLFEYFVYKGEIVDGYCPDWSHFTGRSLNLPFKSLAVKTLQTYYGKQSGAANQSIVLTNYTCSNPSTIQSILNALRLRSAVSLTCNKNVWRTFSCSFNNIVLCVNCIKSCSLSRSCPDNNILNPCSSKKCGILQPYAAFGIMRVTYEEVPLYPQFSRILAAPSLEGSITLNISTFNNPGLVTCATELVAIPRIFSLSDIQRYGQTTTIATSNGTTYNASTSLPLIGLAPVSLYRIYCFTQDFDINRMPFDEALRYTTLVETSGSPRIVFDKANFTSIVSIGAVQVGQASSFSSLLQDRTIGVSVSIPVLNTTSIAIFVTEDNTMPGCTSNPMHSQGLIVSPNVLEFTRSNPYVTSTLSFAIRAPSGCYKVVANDISSSNSLLLNTAVLYIQIRQVSEAPVSPPQLLSVTFSRDGCSLVINFDRSTDRGSTYFSNRPHLNYNEQQTFPCNIMLSINTGLVDWTCRWPAATGRSLFVDITAGKTLVAAGDIITFSPYIIRTKCSGSVNCTAFPPLVSANSVVIAAPDVVNRPFLSLLAPPLFILCGDVNYSLSSTLSLKLNPLGSQSRAIRNNLWKAIGWSAFYVSSGIRTYDASLSTFLTTTYGESLDRIAAVPAHLVKGGTLIIRLTGTSYFNATSFAEATVDVQEDIIVPVGRFVLPERFFRNQQLQVSSYVDFPVSTACQVSLAIPRFAFNWSLYDRTDNYHFLSGTNYQSTSKDPSVYRLPPFTLTTNREYLIVLTISIAGSATQSTILVGNILVNSPGVIASLNKVASQSSVFKNITLSAMGSKNLAMSVSEISSQGLGLNFTWTCVQLFPLFGSPCLSKMIPAISDNSIVSYYIPGTVLNKYNESFPWPYTVYNFSVTVFDSNDMSVSDVQYIPIELIYNKRYQSASETSESRELDESIQFVIPDATVSGVYTRDYFTLELSPALYFNPDQRIIVDGLIAEPYSTLFGASLSNDSSSIAGFFVTWDLIDTPLPSSSVLSKSATRNFSLSSSFRRDISFIDFQLVLAPYSFPEGSSYTLRMRTFAYSMDAYISSQYESTVEITFSINSAPRGGVFTVIPSSGAALSTVFAWATSGWIDDADSYPLFYSLGIAFSIDDQMLFMKEFDYDSFLSTQMPSISRRNNLTVITFCKDFYEAVGNITAVDNLNVAPEPYVNSSKYFADLGYALADPLGLQSQEILRRALISASSLSFGNCSLAPNCSSLNRQECLLTKHTCGRCLDGYLGIGEDSNERCTESSILAPSSGLLTTPLLQLDSLLSESFLGFLCTSNADCASGVCLDGSCEDFNKSCINDCSGHGQCIVTSWHQPLAAPPFCKYLDQSCKVSCSCELGYYGQDCSIIDLNIIVLYNNFAASICSSQLRDLISAIDPSYANILAYAQAVLSVVNYEPVLLNSTNYQQCTAILYTFLTLDMTVAAKSVLFAQLANQFFLPVIKSTDRASSTAREEILDMISTLLLSYMDNLEVYEAGYELGEEALTIATFKHSQEEATVETLASSNWFSVSLDIRIPVGKYRSLEASNGTRLHFTYSNMSRFVHNVAVLQIPYWDYFGSLFSNSSRVIFSSSLTTESIANSSFDITLANKRPISYAPIGDTVTKTVYCAPKLRSYNITIDCKYSNEELYHEVVLNCPGYFAYSYHNITCPHSLVTPTCMRRVLGSSEIYEDCLVQTYTDSHTTCACSLVPEQSIQSRRALNGHSDDVSQELFSTSTIQRVSTNSIQFVPTNYVLHIPPVVEMYAMALLFASVLILALSRVVFIYSYNARSPIQEPAMHTKNKTQFSTVTKGPIISWISSLFHHTKVHIALSPEGDKKYSVFHTETGSIKKSVPNPDSANIFVKSRTVKLFFTELLPTVFKNRAVWDRFNQALYDNHILSCPAETNYGEDMAALDSAGKDSELHLYDAQLSSSYSLFNTSRHFFSSSFYKSILFTLQLLNYFFVSTILMLIVYNDNVYVKHLVESSISLQYNLPGRNVSNISGSFQSCEDINNEYVCNHASDSLSLIQLCQWEMTTLSCSYTVNYGFSSAPFMILNIVLLYYCTQVLNELSRVLCNVFVMYIYHMHAERNKESIAEELEARTFVAPEKSRKDEKRRRLSFSNTGKYRVHKVNEVRQLLKQTLNPYLQQVYFDQVTINQKEDELCRLQSRPSNYMKAVLVSRLKFLFDNQTAEEEVEYLIHNTPLSYLSFAQIAKLEISNARLFQLLKVSNLNAEHSSKNNLPITNYSFMGSMRNFSSARHLQDYKTSMSLKDEEDYSNVNGEVISPERTKKELQRLHEHYYAVDNISNEQLLFNCRYYHFVYHRLLLKSRLHQCKKEMKAYAKFLNSLNTSHEQDKYLVMQFIATLTPSLLQRRVLEQICFSSKYFMDFYLRLPYKVLLLAFVSFQLYIAAILFCAFYYNVHQAAPVFYLQFAILTYTLVIDYGVLQPIYIFVTSISIPSLVRNDFLSLHYLLYKKCSFLLSRRASLLHTNVHDLLHNFNPVMRIIRKVMKLPIARMLIAVNRMDLSLKEQIQSREYVRLVEDRKLRAEYFTWIYLFDRLLCRYNQPYRSLRNWSAVFWNSSVLLSRAAVFLGHFVLYPYVCYPSMLAFFSMPYAAQAFLLHAVIMAYLLDMFYAIYLSFSNLALLRNDWDVFAFIGCSFIALTILMVYNVYKFSAGKDDVYSFLQSPPLHSQNKKYIKPLFETSIHKPAEEDKIPLGEVRMKPTVRVTDSTARKKESTIVPIHATAHEEDMIRMKSQLSINTLLEQERKEDAESKGELDPAIALSPQAINIASPAFQPTPLGSRDVKAFPIFTDAEELMERGHMHLEEDDKKVDRASGLSIVSVVKIKARLKRKEKKTFKRDQSKSLLLMKRHQSNISLLADMQSDVVADTIRPLPAPKPDAWVLSSADNSDFEENESSHPSPTLSSPSSPKLLMTPTGHIFGADPLPPSSSSVPIKKPNLRFFARYDSSSNMLIPPSNPTSAKIGWDIDNQDIVDSVDYGADPFRRAALKKEQTIARLPSLSPSPKLTAQPSVTIIEPAISSPPTRGSVFRSSLNVSRNSSPTKRESLSLAYAQNMRASALISDETNNTGEGMTVNDAVSLWTGGGQGTGMRRSAFEEPLIPPSVVSKVVDHRHEQKGGGESESKSPPSLFDRSRSLIPTENQSVAGGRATKRPKSAKVRSDLITEMDDALDSEEVIDEDV
ncbi:hypothetical protein EON65_15265, partial [archaeon]